MIMWKLDVIGAVFLRPWLCSSSKFPSNSMQSFFRSLSATASDDNVMSVNKEEARDIIQGGEGEKAAEVVEQNKEEDVVLQKDVFPTQQVDHLKAWVADASPSDRLRLMKHIVDLQAQILNLHTE